MFTVDVKQQHNTQEVFENNSEIFFSFLMRHILWVHVRIASKRRFYLVHTKYFFSGFLFMITFYDDFLLTVDKRGHLCQIESVRYFFWKSKMFGQVNSVCLLVLGQVQNIGISTVLNNGLSITLSGSPHV